MTDMEDRCLVCGQTRRWHMEHSPHHAFSITSSTPERVPQGPPPTPLRGDAVLRLTLMRKGLVSEVELEETRQLVERAAEFGRAVVLEPDPDGLTGWKFDLVTQDELIRRMLSKEDHGHPHSQEKEESQVIPVRPAG